ncbi:MAG: AAA family ATPase [Pirellulaceae bacterium]
MLEAQRTRQLITHVRPAAFNDYYYCLSESGQKRAQSHMAHCSYIGRAPVSLSDYVLSVEAQAAGLDPIGYDELRVALSSISHNAELLDQLGPAVNSNSGLFLFGPPGNGKTTIARCLTRCLGQEVWIPHAIYDDGNLIKLQDDAFHRPMPIAEAGDGIMKSKQWDHRWVRIQRPTVIVGGELVMENLEVRHDSRSNTCEAPLQMKSNCGCLLIDDFGRQRIAPEELLNRWIIPLENRIDFLTLPTGKKVEIPFEQLIIFSTNLNPDQLVDEAFLRRVPYKIFVSDPDPKEFARIFNYNVERMGFPPAKGAAEHLLRFYEQSGRSLRRCQPRDILTQVVNFCKYRKIAPQLRPDFLDQACKSYFSEL